MCVQSLVAWPICILNTCQMLKIVFLYIKVPLHISRCLVFGTMSYLLLFRRLIGTLCLGRVLRLRLVLWNLAHLIHTFL